MDPLATHSAQAHRIIPYHLEPLVHLGSTLSVLLGDSNVLLLLLFRQVNHVAGEERLAVLVEELLIGIEHAIQPGEELLGAMVGVEDNGDVVGRSHRADVVGSGNGTGNGSILVGVGDTLRTNCQYRSL